METPAYPGAVEPERTRSVRSQGLRLRVYEWGDPEGAPLVLSHGMFDHGRGFDVLAPLLAERFRVVAFDARGHGDSEWADAYLWPFEIMDLIRVVESTGGRCHLVGHSRGGGLSTDAATWRPDLVRQLVNIDGFGPPPEGFTMPGRRGELEQSVPERFAGFLDRRRGAFRSRWRPYRSVDELVARRSAQNPRLGHDWLRYFLFHGARQVEGGWVWKADPLSAQGFGPWRPEWIGPGWSHLRAPMLAVTGSVPDTWGPLPEALIGERLAHVRAKERAVVPEAGHFVHMERPAETAALLLDWLDA